jgi:hypothetical protein
MKTLSLSSLLIALMLTRSARSADDHPTSASEPIGYWNVTDENGAACIRMRATISLNLDYQAQDSTIKSSGPIVIPDTAPIMNESTCNGLYEGTAIRIQVLKLDLGHHWTIAFKFSTDPKLGSPYQQDYFSMYQIVVDADYTTMPDQFHDPLTTHHTYYREVSFGDDSSWTLTQDINAAPQYSLSCPSKQTFLFTEETEQENGQNLKGYITFSNFRLQAFAADTNDFMPEQVCAADQHADDLVPVIVGGVLAGLIVVTLLVYLVYRHRLPPETIHLVNPHSHFDRSSNAYDNKLNVIEDESDGSATGDEESPRSNTLNDVSHH